MPRPVEKKIRATGGLQNSARTTGWIAALDTREGSAEIKVVPEVDSGAQREEEAVGALEMEYAAVVALRAVDTAHWVAVQAAERPAESEEGYGEAHVVAAADTREGCVGFESEESQKKGLEGQTDESAAAAAGAGGDAAAAGRDCRLSPTIFET